MCVCAPEREEDEEKKENREKEGNKSSSERRERREKRGETNREREGNKRDSFLFSLSLSLSVTNPQKSARCSIYPEIKIKTE